MTTPQSAEPVVITREGLDRLVEALIAGGYQVIGPTVRDSAIVLGELDSADALPAGWGVDTGPGYYRLHRRDDAAVFAHSAGPGSWKQFLHPPRRPLWSTDSEGGYRPAEVPPQSVTRSSASGAVTSPRSGSWDGCSARALTPMARSHAPARPCSWSR